MKYKIEDVTYKGTNILLGDTAKHKRVILDFLSKEAANNGFKEIFLPIIELTETYTNKMGKEIVGQMFNFRDKSDRDVCLRPEGTATCQHLANTLYKHDKNVKLFYTVECFRYEQPQQGRYRQFTQFGVEWLNPTISSAELKEQLCVLASAMVLNIVDDYDAVEVKKSVKRGLSYYTEEGFEIEYTKLGAQKQICGGGTYAEGCGFAIGVDRILAIKDQE